MPPTKLLIFGSPKAGTPLMLAAPSIAIDLPLKILVWEDNQRKVWVSYNSPAYLREQHGVPQELLQNIAVVETVAPRQPSNSPKSGLSHLSRQPALHQGTFLAVAETLPLRKAGGTNSRSPDSAAAMRNLEFKGLWQNGVLRRQR